jgi:hypothetical protein
MFPDECVQSIVGAANWWEKNSDKKICRGALAFAFIPHVDQIPYTLEPLGRGDPEQHKEAILRVSPLKTNHPLKPTALPVAAMTLNDGEVWAAYRAKKRPCLVLGTTAPEVDRTLTRGSPKASTAPTILVAPYYGVKKNAQRAGYKPEFVERVRQCEYPQFLWDILPIPGGEESILRLDHLQAVGAHHDSYALSDYRLTVDALEVVDELLNWVLLGGVEEDSLVALYRAEIEHDLR